MNFLSKILTRSDNDSRKAEFEQALIRGEAEIGGQLFGPVPKGHKRQFFCLDEHTWIWHEEWVDQNGQQQIVTTQYDVRPTVGVLKSQNGQLKQRLSLNEARNLYKAAELYYQRVDAAYQHMLAA